VIAVASAMGAPISTTHVTTTAIMGVGASKRISAVRWLLASHILWAWVITLPISALMGAIMTLVIKWFMHLLHCA
jgi:inorganic phosphate transporter, PiT family